MERIKDFWPIAIVLGLLCAGCSVARLNIVPAPEMLQSTFQGSCGEIVVKKISSAEEARRYSNTLSGFIFALEKSGLAREVYYHKLSKEPVPLALEVHFNKTISRNLASTTPKAILSTLSFGLLLPVITYSRDYDLKATMDIYLNERKVRTVAAKAHARYSGNFFDMQKAPTEVEELGKSVYRQLLVSLDSYCSEARSGGP